MKNFRLLLTLFVVSICSMQSAWARTAPTFPTAKSLESGKTYYLYNVGSDRFLFFNNTVSSYPKALTDKGSAVKISLVNGTQYSIQFVDTEYYMVGASQRVSCKSYYSSTDESLRFTIQAVNGGYTIKRVYNSTESEYIGFAENNNNALSSNLTEGNIVWQLLDVDETTRFIAKRNLYRALESADGYLVDKYENVYENESSSNYALQEAADALNKAVDASNKIKIPEWSDYKVLLEMNTSDPWTYSSDSYRLSHWVSNGTASLNAVVEVDEDATFVFDYSSSYARGVLEVYLDNTLVQTVNKYQGNSYYRYFVELTPGKHEIELKHINMTKDGNYCYISNIGVEKTPTIIVSLKEPGSLGTEVLSQTDHVQNVRKLIVSGEMNDDDWARILMMTSIFSLDLTNTTNTEIPEKQLSRDYHSNELSFLHEVKLPNTLKVINPNAFNGTYLDEITFPEGLTTIEKYAFYDTRIQKALIPETVTTIGDGAFEYCRSLQQVTVPAAAKVVPQDCFEGCYVLQPFEIPEGIISIKSEAFYNCYSFNSSIPSTLTNIGYRAFYNTSMDNVKINEGTTIDSYAFENCKNLTNIELPTTLYNEVYYMLSSCPNLTDVYFKSPTMVKSRYKNIFSNNTASNITIHVPSYLVNTYKLDEYWYNYNITGFSTSDITDWYITQPLKMSAGERFEGTPNVSVLGGGYWTINGDDAMTINNFQTEQKTNRYSNKIESASQVLSNCENISITGDYTHKLYTESKRWYFVTLPFDTKVGDITNSASFVVRYYDGANRAENGTGGNWKNYSKDDIIPAGTGFIFQTSQEGWSTFKAQDNASKQYVLANKIFTKALSVNASENKEHKGWNLVGNPWMSYYNIHKLNFTAPITCWHPYYQSYTAYSVIDDDYAILPNEAFFVQCPNEEIASISFPIDGRQMTDEIESQNASRYLDGMTESEHDASSSVAASRKLIDIEITDGERADKTRFVLNANAKMDYETSCDASKFFSMNAATPQIYTIQNGIQMAINERPAGDGIIQIGVLIPANGTYTINSNRNAFLEAVLVDKQTGIETNLSSDSYTFSAEAGTDTNRFELHLSPGEVTGIKVVDKTQTEKNVYYNLNGQRVDVPTTGVYVVNGKKVIIK